MNNESNKLNEPNAISLAIARQGKTTNNFCKSIKEGKKKFALLRKMLAHVIKEFQTYAKIQVLVTCLWKQRHHKKRLRIMFKH